MGPPDSYLDKKTVSVYYAHKNLNQTLGIR